VVVAPSHLEPFGPRVIGVVLSGHQSCGTAGLLSTQARDGGSVVQEPATAEAPELPRNALDSMTVDHLAAPLERVPRSSRRWVDSRQGRTVSDHTASRW
jgi:two-component system chemotaxis response regulator CheB